MGLLPQAVRTEIRRVSRKQWRASAATASPSWRRHWRQQEQKNSLPTPVGGRCAMAVSLAGLAARRPQAEAEQEGQSEAEQQQQPGQHLGLCCLGSVLL